MGQLASESNQGGPGMSAEPLPDSGFGAGQDLPDVFTVGRVAGGAAGQVVEDDLDAAAELDELVSHWPSLRW
jgi:hypothetical protein